MATSYSLYNTTASGDSAAPRTEGVAVTASDPVRSSAWSANNRSWGLHVITTGTLTGTWTLWASDKRHPDESTDADWVDTSAHADFVETNPAGAATNWRVNSTLIKATWLRLKFVQSGGSGTIYAYVTAETAL